MATQDFTLANRDDPVPVIQFDISKLAPSADGGAGSKEQPTSNVKQRARAASDGDRRNVKGSFQERMFGLLLQQVLPETNAHREAPSTPKKGKQTVTVEKPNFSLPIMSANFRRFNARIGVVFVFQNRVSRLLSWKVPTHTMSLLAVYTFCCLNPNLITIIPLVICLFAIMEPAFVARHPPPASTHFLELHAGSGPATAAPVQVKPVPEMSKDFFRNIRDLQNSMEDFSIAHDGVVQLVASRTNFSDERLSSVIYQGLFALALVLLIAANLIPLRPIALLFGWCLISAGHPEVAKLIAAIDKKPFKDAYDIIKNYMVHWMNEDILLDGTLEKREVEIFEVQRQSRNKKWEAGLYSASPYVMQSRSRISGILPKGAALFEDVQAPKGWAWSAKKWDLDLQSQQWVDERMLTSVEVETEGQRWVYDAGSATSSSAVAVHGLGTESGSEDLWRRRRWTRTVRRQPSEPKVGVDAKK